MTRKSDQPKVWKGAPVNPEKDLCAGDQMGAQTGPETDMDILLKEAARGRPGGQKKRPPTLDSHDFEISFYA